MLLTFLTWFEPEHPEVLGFEVVDFHVIRGYQIELANRPGPAGAPGAQELDRADHVLRIGAARARADFEQILGVCMLATGSQNPARDRPRRADRLERPDP